MQINSAVQKRLTTLNYLTVTPLLASVRSQNKLWYSRLRYSSISQKVQLSQGVSVIVIHLWAHSLWFWVGCFYSCQKSGPIMQVRLSSVATCTLGDSDACRLQQPLALVRDALLLALRSLRPQRPLLLIDLLLVMSVSRTVIDDVSMSILSRRHSRCAIRLCRQRGGSRQVSGTRIRISGSVIASLGVQEAPHVRPSWQGVDLHLLLRKAPLARLTALHPAGALLWRDGHHLVRRRHRRSGTVRRRLAGR